MKYKRRSTGEEKVQKIAAGEEGNYRMERVPLKQTDRHHKSPGGDLCIRDSPKEGTDTFIFPKTGIFIFMTH
ncbi:hypothetical protein AL502_00345 (plasmid) [Escherichia coli]|nr:hypothetical protein AL502_00345 [Escherichia coli]